MQPKVSTKVLVEECLKGNFRYVHGCIASKSALLENNSAVKVIVAVCNACHSNFATPDNINERDLADLITCLLKLIHVPSNELYESYAQSAFYILKLFLEKKNFDCILQLRDLFIPEFMPLILTEKHHTIYQSICKTIYNTIVRTCQTSDTTHKSKITKLATLLASIHKRLDRKSAFLESVHKCLLALTTLNISSDELTQYYQYVIKSLSCLDATLYPSVVNNLSLLYSHLLRNEKYKLASSCYECTSELLNTLKGKEFGLLADVMAIVEWLNPRNGDALTTQTPERSHASLKSYHKNYGSTAALQSVCDFVSSAATTVLQLHKKSNTWVENVAVHSHYYKFLSDVALIMAKTPFTCTCAKCSTTTNFHQAVRTLNTLGGFCRLCITKNPDVQRSYKVDTLRYLERFVEYVTTIKSNRCEKWQTYWYDVGVHLYSIGTTFYHKRDTEMVVLYLQKFIQVLLEFEGLNPKIIQKTYLVSALNCVADSYLESHDFERTLLVSSLAVVCSDSPKNEMNRWLKAKVVSRENTIEENRELQELTLVSVLRKYKAELLNYVPKTGLLLSAKRQIELLVLELRHYQAKWKSKIPMSCAFAELSHIASSQLAAEVFIEIWGDGDLLVHETIPKLLRDTITRVESEDVERKDLLLAHLYFLQHKYKVKDAIVKNCDEMERTMNLTKAAEAAIVPPDPDEDCDLVSSYECLKLSRYTKMMENLNKSLELCRQWQQRQSDDYDKSRFYKLLANVGHEFALHGLSTKSLNAWELALKVASSAVCKLEATGFILELSDVRKPFIRQLATEAEKGVTTATNKDTDVLTVYYLSKAEAFMYVDFDKAYSSFKEALKYEHQSSTLMKARIHLLHHKFITLPCKYNVPDHQEYSLVKIHQANNCVNAYYNEASTISSYEMRVFFEVYETIAKMYHDLRLPREVRCYAKDGIVIAQKMVLPFRTAALLYYLAHADITTCRLGDCRVKIKDFSDILGLGKSTDVTNSSVLPPLKKKDIEILVEEFKEIVLDAPKRVRSTSSGSPCFQAETFKLPTFLTHDEECECFYCTCFEYQEFVLKKTLLHALLYEHEKHMSTSKDFFYGCTTIYDHLRNREGSYSRKVARRISADLVPSLKEKFAEIYCRILLEYGGFLIRVDKLSDAESLNTKLMAKIEPFSSRFVHLYNEVLLQRLNILSWNVVPQPRAVETQETEVAGVKTPTSQRSKVVLSPNPNPPKTVEVKRILPKSLKFDFSDEEDEMAHKKVTLPKNVPSSTNKTPAPSTSKIKIYSEPSKKSKAVLAEIPPFKEPEAKGTPSVSGKGGGGDNLASRTRLLTERLRSSSRNRKGASGQTADENAERPKFKELESLFVASNIPKNLAKDSANVARKSRQNLMGQLEGAEGQNGVRRSERKKK